MAILRYSIELHAWAEGIVAAQKGGSPECPYLTDDENSLAWTKGYNDGRSILSLDLVQHHQ